MKLDARIPVVIGGAAAAGDHVVTPGADWGEVHPLGCACCVARSPAALALDTLFLDRVRGAIPWFARLRVTGGGDAVAAAVRDDPVASLRFRLVPEIGLDDAG